MPSPRTGQVNLGATAQQLSTTSGGAAFVIKAPLSNLNPAYVGPSTVTTANGYQLDPGDELTSALVPTGRGTSCRGRSSGL
jgi:hypothetical protein